jgi:D-sedoheptulose 7-phosphate isomerase
VINYINTYFKEIKTIIDTIDKDSIRVFMERVKEIRDKEGRLFICGVGGSAANASHAVNDFRKILGIETYTPTDNVSELTARINDESWEDSYVNWLKVSKIKQKDAIMILSVGGGSDHTSKNLVKVMKYAKEVGSTVLSIVSRDGGYAKEVSDGCILIPVVHPDRITPHAEEWQGILWHMIVSGIGSL